MKKHSLFSIIFWLIFFFPVAIYFIYDNLTSSPVNTTVVYAPAKKKEASKDSYKKTMYWLGGFGVLFLISGLGNLLSDFGAGILGLVISGVCLYLAYIRYMTLKSNEKYIEYFEARQEATIKEVAKYVGRNEKKAKEDITQLIGKKILPFHFVGEDRVIQNGVIPTQNLYKEKKKVTITCPFCGANNTIEDSDNPKCEYCGMIMK